MVMRGSDFAPIVEPRMATGGALSVPQGMPQGMPPGGPPARSGLGDQRPDPFAGENPNAVRLMQRISAAVQESVTLLRQLETLPGVNLDHFHKGQQALAIGFKMIAESMPGHPNAPTPSPAGAPAPMGNPPMGNPQMGSPGAP